MCLSSIKRTLDGAGQSDRVNAAHKVVVAQNVEDLGGEARHDAHRENDVVGVGQLQQGMDEDEAATSQG